jgi:hypothetical protein
MMWKRREQPKLISIHTKRYSAFMRRLLEEYSQDTTAVIDRKRFASTDFPQLIATWCTNARIRATRGFKLLRGRMEIAGFHDTPDDMFIAATELPFVRRLAAEKIIRYDAPQNI